MAKSINRETRKKERAERRKAEKAKHYAELGKSPPAGLAINPVLTVVLSGLVLCLALLWLGWRTGFLQTLNGNTTTFETGNLTFSQKGVAVVYDDTDLEFGNSHFRAENVDYNLFKSVAVVPDGGTDEWWEFLIVEDVKLADDYYKYRSDYLTWGKSSGNPHDYFLRNWINPSLEILASDTELLYGVGESGVYGDWQWRDLGVFADGEDFKLSMGLRTYFKSVGDTLVYATCYTTESENTFKDFESYLSSCSISPKTSKTVEKKLSGSDAVSKVLYDKGVMTVYFAQGESSTPTGQRVKAGGVYIDGVNCSAHAVIEDDEKYLDFKTLDSVDLTSYGLVTESGYNAKVYIDVPPDFPYKHIEFITIELLDYDTGVYVDSVKVKTKLKVSLSGESQWVKKTPMYEDANLKVYYQGSLSGNLFYVVENLSSKEVRNLELEAGGTSYKLSIRGHLKTDTVQANTIVFLNIPAYTYDNNLTVETLIESVSLNTDAKITYTTE